MPSIELWWLWLHAHALQCMHTIDSLNFAFTVKINENKLTKFSFIRCLIRNETISNGNERKKHSRIVTVDSVLLYPNGQNFSITCVHFFLYWSTETVSRKWNGLNASGSVREQHLFSTIVITFTYLCHFEHCERERMETQHVHGIGRERKKGERTP